MTINRWDETWHRLLNWTSGQAPSERLAAQVLAHEKYSSIDPSHPLGGRDGGKDGICEKDGKKWIMAVYFPRGPQGISGIRKKFMGDLKGVAANQADGIAFVTNQEISVSERNGLQKRGKEKLVEIYHLDRITTILDQPEMSLVRKQFLGIDYDGDQTINLGGSGGANIGAGGGGGAAVGLGAKAGNGGPGGNIIHINDPNREVENNLSKLDYPYGAGGAGAGALGEYSTGGDGGAGGDRVIGKIYVEEPGFVEARLGRGGQAGGPGEDTIINVKNTDGKVKKTYIAKGGRAASIPSISYPERNVEQKDVESGLSFFGIMLSEAAYVRLDGSLYLIACGSNGVGVSTNPFEFNYFISLSLSTGCIEKNVRLKFSYAILDPSGFQTFSDNFYIQRSMFKSAITTHVLPLRINGSKMGTWKVKIFSGDMDFVEFPVEVFLLTNNSLVNQTKQKMKRKSKCRRR